jgi:hypothetical protein
MASEKHTPAAWRIEAQTAKPPANWKAGAIEILPNFSSCQCPSIRLRLKRSPPIDPDANRVSAPDGRLAPGWKAPFVWDPPNAIGALSILLQIEVRCPIAPSRHRGRPKNTPPIMSSEIVMGRGWRISTTKTNLADGQPPSYSPKMKLGGWQQTSPSCQSCWSVDDVYLSEELIVLTPCCSKNTLERDHASPILVVGCRIAHGIASHDDT